MKDKDHLLPPIIDVVVPPVITGVAAEADDAEIKRAIKAKVTIDAVAPVVAEAATTIDPLVADGIDLASITDDVADAAHAEVFSALVKIGVSAKSIAIVFGMASPEARKKARAGGAAVQKKR